MGSFKGYTKESTSKFMMRIDKRERILACILGDSSLSGHPVSLTLREVPEHEDYLDWKVSMIRETTWLYDFSRVNTGSTIIAEWKDSNKLRIYRQWTYIQNKKTFEKVLKYMHSPLFAAIILMDSGYKNAVGEIAIDTGVSYGQNADMLSRWFSDIMGLPSEVVKTKHAHYISFDYLSSKRYLEAIEPIVSQIPSMYDKLYSLNKRKAVMA